MQGRRLPEGEFARRVDAGVIAAGDYGINDDGAWMTCTPAEEIVGVADEHVTEQIDGRITVDVPISKFWLVEGEWS